MGDEERRSEAPARALGRPARIRLRSARACARSIPSASSLPCSNREKPVGGVRCAVKRGATGGAEDRSRCQLNQMKPTW